MPQEENWYWVWVSDLCSLLLSLIFAPQVLANLATLNSSLFWPEPCAITCIFFGFYPLLTYLSFLLPNLWQELTDVLSTSAFRKLGSPQWAFLFTGVWILNFGFHRNSDAFKQMTFDMLLISFLSSFLVGMLVSYKLLWYRRHWMLWIWYYTQMSCLWFNSAGQYERIAATEQPIIALRKWTMYYKWLAFWSL